MFGWIPVYSRDRPASAPADSPISGSAKSPIKRLLSDRPGPTLWLLCATIVLGIITLSFVELQSRYFTAISDAERSTQSFTDILAEHTARTFEAVERTLLAAQSIRSDLASGRIPDQKAAKQALQNLHKSAPALLAIGWTDADGNLIASSYEGEPVRQNIADLDHFTAQQDGSAQGLYIAHLFRSKATQRWISSVSVRLEDADGRFAGVVTAPLDLSYFARIYRLVKLGANDTVTLVRSDGRLLTREPFVESAVGQSFSGSVLFQKLLPKSDFGVGPLVSPIDGKTRIFAYRVVTGLPLIMATSADRKEILAPWHEHVRTLVPIACLIIGVIIFGTFVLWRRTYELERQSTLLEATLSNMHQGLIVVDQTDHIAICNRKAMELLDLPEGLMTSRPRSQDVIAHQMEQGEFADLPDNVLARVQPRLFGETSHVYERTRPNGTVLEVRTVPFATGGTIRTYKDITNWKHLEQELSERERQFRLLAENATDIIARLDFKGRLHYISPSTLPVLGYHPKELTGVTVTDFIRSDDVDAVVGFFTRLLQGNSRGETTIEYRFLHKQGHWIWLEASPTLVLDGEGRPLEFVDVVRDVSKRKAVEAEADLSRQRAERAALAQSQFLATMSHELRTPLNSIVGFSDIVLGRRDLDFDVRRQIQLIQTASDSLLAVVNDILDFAKIEEGKMVLASVAFDLASLIEDSMSIVRGSAHAKHLDLRLNRDEQTSPHLVGDDQRLRQVLLNLLNNAIKFTNSGYVSLAVDRIGMSSNSESLRFTVADTGIGIADENIPGLFERFTQVDGSISREFGGSGLGLAISKRLIEAMGGRIGVRSIPGKGSEFWFEITLPVAGYSSASDPAVRVMPQTTPARLLLVEDVDVNREIACSVLLSLGYDVDAVADGAEAVASVKMRNYDLVLMDIQMPGMDGITATRHIRMLPGRKGAVPIVAMTANVLPAQVESFRSAGMDGHVGKPFKRETLIETIESCLKCRPACEYDTLSSFEPTLDPEAIATLTTLLGGEKVDQLLEKLSQQLRIFVALLSTASSDPEMKGRQAHNLVSSAGMLGFLSVSESCSILENEIAAGVDTAELVASTREICVSAVNEISQRLGHQDTATGHLMAHSIPAMVPAKFAS